MENIAFVSCVKGKRDNPSMAKDLYTSSLFKKARHYVEGRFDKWFILSAQYGLLDPEEVVEPYEKTLNNMGTVERKIWSNEVYDQIQNKLPGSQNHSLYFFVVKKYRDYLIPKLERDGYQIEVPLRHLGIGKQLGWYDRQNKGIEEV